MQQISMIVKILCLYFVTILVSSSEVTLYGEDAKCEIGCYGTDSTTITLPGFHCGGDSYSDGGVNLYWPRDLEGTYPVVSFLHGSGNGNFGGVCSTIASLGFIVLAPTKWVCGDMSDQQMHAIEAASQNQDIHPALAHADYTRVGVMGHSQGAAFSMGSAAFWDSKRIIKACIASHGQSANAAPHLPENMAMMYSAGSSDPKTHKLYWSYQATPSLPAMFYNLAGAAHMEPTHEGISNEWTAHFMNCHVKGNQFSCYKMYGIGPDTACKKVNAGCSYHFPAKRSRMTIGYYIGDAGSQCETEDNVIKTTWECQYALNELKLDNHNTNGDSQGKFSQNTFTTELPSGCSYDGGLSYNWNTNLDETVGVQDRKPVCRKKALYQPTQSPTHSPKPTASPSLSPTNPTVSPSKSPVHEFNGYEMLGLYENCHSDYAVINTPEECEEALREIGVKNPEIVWNGWNNDIPAGCSYRPAECSSPDCHWQPNQAHFNWNLKTSQTKGRDDLQPACRKLTKCDIVREQCCAYNTKYGMIPYQTWGSTPESEQAWYEQHDCNNVMGGQDLNNCPYTCDSDDSDSDPFVAKSTTVLPETSTTTEAKPEKAVTTTTEGKSEESVTTTTEANSEEAVATTVDANDSEDSVENESHRLLENSLVAGVLVGVLFAAGLLVVCWYVCSKKQEMSRTSAWESPMLAEP